MCEIVILAHIWDAFDFLRKFGCDKVDYIDFALSLKKQPAVR
jgi:hypothetical protein